MGKNLFSPGQLVWTHESRHRLAHKQVSGNFHQWPRWVELAPKSRSLRKSVAVFSLAMLNLGLTFEWLGPLDVLEVGRPESCVSTTQTLQWPCKNLAHPPVIFLADEKPELGAAPHHPLPLVVQLVNFISCQRVKLPLSRAAAWPARLRPANKI